MRQIVLTMNNYYAEYGGVPPVRPFSRFVRVLGTDGLKIDLTGGTD